MEAKVALRVRPSALLLEHAFGRRLMEGEDEWHGVDSVVRSSFLLLYREFRRQDKRLRVLEANPPTPPKQPQATRDGRSALVHEQLQLLKEELQLVKSELQELRSTRASCKCRFEDPKATLAQQAAMTQVAVQAQRQWHRHQKLRLSVSKLQRRVRGMRRVQHECEEIVVRTAEKHQRQVQGLYKKICGDEQKRARLAEDVETRVKPRVKLLEKHVVAMHRKLKSVAKGPEERQDDTKDSAVVSSTRAVIAEDEGKAPTRFQSMDRGTEPVCTSYCSPKASPVEVGSRPLPLDFDNQHFGGGDEEDDDELLDFEPPILNPRGHATLRLRYEHERKRQIRRLDRLRRAKISPRSVTGT